MLKKITALVLVVSICAAMPSVSEAAQSRHKRVQNHAPVKVLPKGHHTVVHKGKSYYYSAGRFYRHANGSYVAIAAPIGAIVPVLPGGYVSFGVGINRYFYFQGTYYRHVGSGYEVIEEPEQAQQVLATGSDKLIIYPASGQTEGQLDKDRYECHVWSSDETHFDPTDADSDALLKADYHRAMSACLEARDYVVK